MSITLSNSVE